MYIWGGGGVGGGGGAGGVAVIHSTSLRPSRTAISRRSAPAGFTSLGERSERTALMTIAQTEMDRDLRTRAILTLGQAGGNQELRLLYTKFGVEFKRPIIQGLFNARADDELILLADRERDRTVRQELYDQLRLLGTPKAKEYLQKVSVKK